MNEIKLYNLRALAEEMPFDGKIYKDVKFQGYVVRKKEDLDIDYSLVFGADYEYYDEKEDTVTEEFLYVQELATEAELQLIREKLEPKILFNPFVVTDFFKGPKSRTLDWNKSKMIQAKFDINDDFSVVVYTWEDELVE